MTTPTDPDPAADESTGLPRLRRWPTVYAVVFGIFVLYVILLTWLTYHYAP